MLPPRMTSSRFSRILALTALAGLVLTYTYLRAGSIWTPVAVHFLINTIALLIRPPLIRMLGGKSEGAN